MRSSEGCGLQLRGTHNPVIMSAEEDTVGIHYQAVANEDIGDLVCAVVRSLVHELGRVL